jgi:hypothetical protein
MIQIPRQTQYSLKTDNQPGVNTELLEDTRGLKEKMRFSFVPFYRVLNSQTQSFVVAIEVLILF